MSIIEKEQDKRRIMLFCEKYARIQFYDDTMNNLDLKRETSPYLLVINGDGAVRIRGEILLVK